MRTATAARLLRRGLVILMLACAASASLNSIPQAQAQSQSIWIPVRYLAEHLRFKAHQDAPTQVPLGVPAEALAVGAALLFLPTILGITGSTMFGTGTSTTTTLTRPMSCPVFAGPGTILGEDGCVWMKVMGQWTDQSSTTTGAATYHIGGQVEFAPGWFLGGAIGAGSNWTHGGDGVAGSGQTFDGSVALKHTLDSWLFAGAIGFTTSSSHSSHPDTQLQSDVNVYGVGLRLRGAYDFAFTEWYVRPRIDLDLLHTHMPGFQQSRQGVAVLDVSGVSRTSVVATPMMEVGGRIAIGAQTILRPYVAVGASFLPDNNTTFDARFVGPLAVLGGFQTTSSGPGVLANLEAGLQLYQARGFEVKVEYMLSAGDGYLSQGAGLRGAWHF